MQNEQGSKPNHQAFPERLWVFRTGGPEALWAFLAWLNRYGQQIRRYAGKAHSRTVDSTVTAIGTTVFVRFQLKGPRPTDTWPSDVIRRWQQLEARVIPWVESQACVACIQPALRREVDGDGDGHGAKVPAGVDEEGALQAHSLPAPREAAPRKAASSAEEVSPKRTRRKTARWRWVGGRHALGQTPASRMPRRVGDGRPWTGETNVDALDPSAVGPPHPLDDHGATHQDGETRRGDSPTRCHRRRRRIAQRFVWRGFCGANRLRCRRRVGRLGLRPGLGCR